MSFWIMLIIMIICGLIGGVVNFLLPGNNPEPKKFIKPLFSCIILGLGATMLVPVFLAMSNSSLMDNIRFDWQWEAKVSVAVPKKNPAPSAQPEDTGKAAKPDTNAQKGAGKTEKNEKTEKTEKGDGTKAADTSKDNTGKNYLLWGAYCLLAAAAGFKFINMLINNVVKEDQLNKVQKEKEQLERDSEKRTKNSQLSQQDEDQKVREQQALKALQQVDKTAVVGTNAIVPVLPVLSPVTKPNDPQKGRFGGKPERNGRKLSAKVSESGRPGYYNVVLTVESTDEAKKLTSDVIVYLHDSFNPSVYTISPDEFKDGKAIEHKIVSYGAFTIGVITDNGATMLELDLAEDKSFPKEFRER